MSMSLDEQLPFSTSRFHPHPLVGFSELDDYYQFFSPLFFSERTVTTGVSLQNLTVLCAPVILTGQAGAVEVRVQLHHGTPS